MNKFEGCGRLTRDPDIKYSNNDNNTCVSRFMIAINRRFKKDGEPEADFISCVAFSKTAEVMEKYCHKGDLIGIVGRIQTGSYTNKDGQKVYTTDVVVEELHLLQSKGSSNAESTPQNTNSDGFMSIPDGIDEELPFN